MKTLTSSSFLGAAAARADHLRELSDRIRSLNWTSASLRDAEDELPELDVAMSVYRRLSPDGDRRLNPAARTIDPGETAPFLSIAEGRADDLRQITEHLQALDCAQLQLSDIDAEIPELEVAINVYRRLTGEGVETEEAEETDGSRDPALAAPFSFSVSSAVLPPATELEEPEAPAASSFSQFALRHLEQNGNVTTVDTEDDGSR